METRKAEGGVFNVGSDEAVTIRELAERVRRMVDPTIKIVYVPYEQAYGPGFEDIRYRVPDITRLRDIVGYAPTVGLDEILQRVVGFSQQKLSEQLVTAAR
jgi:UDP-glucose 4-epimerase